MKQVPSTVFISYNKNQILKIPIFVCITKSMFAITQSLVLLERILFKHIKQRNIRNNLKQAVNNLQHKPTERDWLTCFILN